VSNTLLDRLQLSVRTVLPSFGLALALSSQPLLAQTSQSQTSTPVTVTSSPAKRASWSPTWGAREYRDDAVTLPNGLVIDRRYEIPEETMRHLGLWLRENSARNWDIMPAQRYTGIVQHATEGDFSGDLMQLQSFGKAHFLIPRSCEGVVYSIVPLSWTANGAGDSHDRYGPAVARRTIQVEHEARERRLLTQHTLSLTPEQVSCSARLLDWLQERFAIPDEDIYSHAQVRVVYSPRDSLVRKRVNQHPGPVYFEDGLVPNRVVARAHDGKLDAASFPVRLVPSHREWSNRWATIDSARVQQRRYAGEFKMREQNFTNTYLKNPPVLPRIDVSFEAFFPESSKP